MTQVFISYSRKDIAFVESLANDLKAAGLEVWYDLSGLEVGTRWGMEIQNALQQSQYFLVVLSPNSIESEWVEKEFLYANSLKRKIIPLLYIPCSLPMWFINLHFIDFQGRNYKLHFPELLKALGIQPGEVAKRVEPSVVIPTTQGSQEIQQPLHPTVDQAEQEPFPLQTKLPAGQEPVEEGKALQQKKPREKRMRPRRDGKVRPAWIIISLVLVAAIAFVIWGRPPLAARLVRTPEAPTTAPTEKVTIIIGVTDTISSLDPADAYASLDGELIKNINDGLLGLKPGTADLEPVLTQTMPVISADGLTYTLKLRPGIKFADGLVLTAPMYAQQLNRLLTIGPTCPNDAADALAIPYVESITAPDDNTIVFKLKSPAAYFSQILALAPYVPSHPDTFPVDKCVLFPTAPIYGVGPWFISQYNRAGQVVLEANPYYTGRYPAQVDQIIIRTFVDQQSMASALQNGEIDIAWRSLDLDLIAPLLNVSGVTVRALPGGGMRYLFLNHSMTPMDDPNVVKAIASAIDRNAITDTVYSGNAIPLYSMIPHGLLGASEAFDTMYAAPNLDQARQYLDASGYTEIHKLVLDLWYPYDHWGASTAAWMGVIKDKLEVTGAITVNLHSQEWTEYIRALNSENSHPAGAWGWFMDYPDPANLMDPFTYNGGMGNNITTAQEGSTFGVPINEKAQQLVDLLSQADVETDQTVRTVLYQQAQEIYADLVVTIPLFMEAQHILYRDKIHGSSQYPTPETLNIGPAFVFSYSLLTKSP
jgi:peptide/nickel transport system substrate-binding protein